jgi:hypothetical protein
MKGVNPLVYAAIMSERDVALADVRREINKMGFQVVGSELEDQDDIPRNVILWIMFGVDRIERNPSLPTRYVRIASITHSGRKTFFRIIDSPWWSTIYYTVLMWVSVKWEKAKNRAEVNYYTVMYWVGIKWEKAKIRYFSAKGHNTKKGPRDGMES